MMYAVCLYGDLPGQIEVLAHVTGRNGVDAARRGVRLCVLPEFHAAARVRAVGSTNAAAVSFLGTGTHLIVMPVANVETFTQIPLREATVLL